MLVRSTNDFSSFPIRTVVEAVIEGGENPEIIEMGCSLKFLISSSFNPCLP